MKTCKDWLAQLMHDRAVTAYGAAKLIGITPDAAYSYVNSRRAFDNFTAFRVAELLDVEPALVIASAEAERTKDADRRAYWQRLGGTAAAVMFVWLMAAPIADPAPALALAEPGACVLCQIQPGSAHALVVPLVTALIFAFSLALQARRR